LTSSMDAGRLYVDLKLLVNCLVSSSQLPIVFFPSLLNHDGLYYIYFLYSTDGLYYLYPCHIGIVTNYQKHT
jgi:hypothetical protein